MQQSELPEATPATSKVGCALRETLRSTKALHGGSQVRLQIPIIVDSTRQHIHGFFAEIECYGVAGRGLKMLKGVPRQIRPVRKVVRREWLAAEQVLVHRMGSGAQGIKRVRFAISPDQLSQDFFRGTRESDNRDEVLL